MSDLIPLQRRTVLEAVQADLERELPGLTADAGGEVEIRPGLHTMVMSYRYRGAAIDFGGRASWEPADYPTRDTLGAMSELAADPVNALLSYLGGLTGARAYMRHRGMHQQPGVDYGAVLALMTDVYFRQFVMPTPQQENPCDV